MGYDNVIILGAGSSPDAGVPLLGNFIETMWEYRVREKMPCGYLLGLTPCTEGRRSVRASVPRQGQVMGLIVRRRTVGFIVTRTAMPLAVRQPK